MTPNEFAQGFVALVKEVKDNSSTCMPIRRPTVKFASYGAWGLGLNAHEHPKSDGKLIWHYQMSSKPIQATHVVTAEDRQLLERIVRAIVLETEYPYRQVLEPLDTDYLLWVWHSDGSAVDTAVIEGTKHLLDKVRTGELTAAPPMASKPLTAGRNEICPCGSGKKFKKCHGAPN